MSNGSNEPSLWNKEVLLDLVVNFVPLFIILFFVGLFWVFNPWGAESTLGRILQYAILVLSFVGLAILTYVSAKKIEGAEHDYGEGENVVAEE
ncbi:DUF6684 family protein [Halospeciosus flavus]|uniref:DUF6684 family protein n=1 Tax=Halospeciosus flavus TaxID=3032283 RepID=A0ABD5Z471_9EURY|nr:DUF6684 family protein [Halospeciosus flavus]